MESDQIRSFASWLPKSAHRNQVTASLRGVIAEQTHREEQCRQIEQFIQQNFNQTHKHRYSQGKYNQLLIDNFSWEEKMINNMKNPGLAFEFFLVDALRRSTYKYRGIEFNHQKASPYLDHKWKVDYVSQILQKNKKSYNLGIQLTTQQSGVKIFPKSYQQEMKKKRKIVKSLSEIIHQDTEIMDYENKSIDMTAYMVVNGHINNTINKEKNNIFMKAFKRRHKEGLHGGGPIKYLPKSTKQDIGKIRLTYHLSLLDFAKFMNKLSHNPQLADTPIEDLYTHQNDAYIITKKYSPQEKELVHQVFINHNKSENLLFSMSYFLNENIAGL